MTETYNSRIAIGGLITMNTSSNFERATLVEEIGHMLEHSKGVPRMAGRIFAVLLTSEKEHLSADEIADYLHASRGSVSTMIRMLVQMSLVKRVSLRGERKRYYQLSNPENMFDAGVVIMQHFIVLVRKAIELTDSDSSIPQKRLQNYLNLYLFFEGEYKNMIERWHQQQQKLS